MDTSEFIVALAASVGFLFTLSQEENLNYTVVLGLMIGGIIAAPLAAWLVRHLPPRLLGALAGGLIVFTNARTLLGEFEATAWVFTVTCTAIVALWTAGVLVAIRSLREERRQDPAAPEREFALSAAEDHNT
ncbi:hypothetical protein ACIOJD_32100 [Streptomyces sp. NPDC088116]|uniref:hypothetical protein n=1 Tax=Streptomyces sp. NPDC088116 TaxID=3365825 RepID=UPI0038018598